VNGVVALLLMKSMLHLGLASALVVSSAFNFVILLYLLRRKIGSLGYKRLVISVFKTCIASAVMGAVIIVVKQWIDLGAITSLWTRGGILVLMILGGVAIFISIIRAINVDEYRALVGMMNRKGRVSGEQAIRD